MLVYIFISNYVLLYIFYISCMFVVFIEPTVESISLANTPLRAFRGTAERIYIYIYNRSCRTSYPIDVRLHQLHGAFVEKQAYGNTKSMTFAFSPLIQLIQVIQFIQLIRLHRRHCSSFWSRRNALCEDELT